MSEEERIAANFGVTEAGRSLPCLSFCVGLSPVGLTNLLVSLACKAGQHFDQEPITQLDVVDCGGVAPSRRLLEGKPSQRRPGVSSSALGTNNGYGSAANTTAVRTFQQSRQTQHQRMQQIEAKYARLRTEGLGP
eukprot:2379294-Amphidinium_carterae.1